MGKAKDLLNEVKSADGVHLTQEEYNGCLKQIEIVDKALRDLYQHSASIEDRLRKEKDKEGEKAFHPVFTEIQKKIKENSDFYKVFNV